MYFKKNQSLFPIFGKGLFACYKYNVRQKIPLQYKITKLKNSQFAVYTEQKVAIICLEIHTARGTLCLTFCTKISSGL